MSTDTIPDGEPQPAAGMILEAVCSSSISVVATNEQYLNKGDELSLDADLDAALFSTRVKTRAFEADLGTGKVVNINTVPV